MKILITGGAGFIGSHLADYFKMHDVLKVDPACKATEGYPSKIEEAWLDGSVWDWVFHCASPVGILGILEHKGSIIQQMVKSTQQVIDICLETGAKLLHVSSSEVYGTSGWLSEASPLVVSDLSSPRAEYQIGKIACEAMVNESGVKAIVVRPFNIIGRSQNPDIGFVVPRFFRAAMQNQPLDVFGTGHQKRCFCDVRDFCEAVSYLMASGEFDTFNVGHSNGLMTINVLATQILKLTRSSSEIRHIDPKTRYKGFREGAQKLPKLDKIAEVGWSASICINDSLQWIYEGLL